MPYLPIDPKDLGRSYDAVIRVNSQSGKGGISYLLEHEFGLELPRRLQIEFSRVVQAVTDDTGKEVDAAQIKAIFDREYGVDDSGVGQVAIGQAADGMVTVQADVRLGDGSSQAVHGIGNGPIDAFVSALQHQGLPVRVLDYHEHAIASGADARAVAYVEMRFGEQTLFGVGMHRNIVTASLNAVVSGVRRARPSLPVAQAASVHA
jgi:2-isopropylmalate synthase